MRAQSPDVPPFLAINPGVWQQTCARLKLQTCIESYLPRIPKQVAVAFHSHQEQSFQPRPLRLTPPNVSHSLRVWMFRRAINRKQWAAHDTDITRVME